MKKMVSAYFKRKSLEKPDGTMNETDLLGDVSTVSLPGNDTLANIETDLLMDEVSHYKFSL